MLIIQSRDQIVSTASGFDPKFGLFDVVAGKNKLIIHTATSMNIQGLAAAIVLERGRLNKPPMAVQVTPIMERDYLKLVITYDDNLVLYV